MLDKKSIEHDRSVSIPGYESGFIPDIDAFVPCDTCRAMAQVAMAFPKSETTENIARTDNMLIDANSDVIACFKSSIKHNLDTSAYSPEMVDHINSILQKRIEEKEQENIQLKTTLTTSNDIKGKD